MCVYLKFRTTEIYSFFTFLSNIILLREQVLVDNVDDSITTDNCRVSLLIKVFPYYIGVCQLWLEYVNYDWTNYLWQKQTNQRNRR